MTAYSRGDDGAEKNRCKGALKKSGPWGGFGLALLSMGVLFTVPAGASQVSCDASGCCEEVVITDDMPSPIGEGQGIISNLVDSYPGSLWTAQIDALMLWQGNIQSQPIFLNQTGGVALNVNQAQAPMSAGPRFGLMRKLSDCEWIEGNYFRVEPFAGSAVLPAGAAPYITTNLADLAFDDVQSATLTTSGRIQSAELNGRWRKGQLVTWIAGFRWVEWNQQANINYAFANPEPYGSGSVNTQTGNNLYGGQLGAEMPLWDAGSRLQVNGIGKAGVFYNHAAYQRSTAAFVTAAGEPFPLGTLSSQADQTAFFGELGVNASLRVTSWLSWRAGYTFFWLSGVALPMNQLPLSSFGDVTAAMNTNGSVLLHGVTTGLEARW